MIWASIPPLGPPSPAFREAAIPLNRELSAQSLNTHSPSQGTGGYGPRHCMLCPPMQAVKPLLQERTKKKVQVLEGNGYEELLKVLIVPTTPSYQCPLFLVPVQSRAGSPVPTAQRLIACSAVLPVRAGHERRSSPPLCALCLS